MNDGTSSSGMSRSAVRWIFSVPGRSRAYVGLIMALQTAYGGTGVFYALFMRDIVDSAVGGNKNGFIWSLICILSLICVQILLYVIINRLSELAKASIEFFLF